MWGIAVDEGAPRRKARLYEGIVQEIEALIRNGVLGPGDQLLPERQLAEQLGVSRGAVREALSALAARGVVRITPGGGAYVADRSIAPLIDLLATVLLYDQDRVQELLEALLVFEAAVARLAATHVRPDDLERLRQAAGDMEAAVAEGRPSSDHNSLFHTRIAEATHNSILIDMMALISGLVQAVHGEAAQTLLAGRQPQAVLSCRHHEAIVAALERGDSEAAGKAMEVHMGSVKENMIAITQERQPPAPDAPAWEPGPERPPYGAGPPLP